MTFHRLSIILILLISSSLSIARSPAVDPMVGIETENYRPLNSEEAFAFDFRNPTLADGQAKIETPKNEVSNSQGQSDHSSFAYFVLLGFLTLPFIMWFFIARNALKNNTPSTIEMINHPNVTSLASFKDRKAESNAEQNANDKMQTSDNDLEDDYKDKAS